MQNLFIIIPSILYTAHITVSRLEHIVGLVYEVLRRDADPVIGYPEIGNSVKE